MEVKSFIKPTTAVRAVMCSQKISTHRIFTNRYKKCRTVKCYLPYNCNYTLLSYSISEILKKMGVVGFSFKIIKNSFIVRIPLSEQPL